MHILEGASFAWFTAPADYYLQADPRLAAAPQSGTSVLCTGQGSFGCKVNCILTPVYPQHKALTEYGNITNALRARIAINIRAFGIAASNLKASMESASDTKAVGIIQLGDDHFLLEGLPARSSRVVAKALKARASTRASTLRPTWPLSGVPSQKRFYNLTRAEDIPPTRTPALPDSPPPMTDTP